MEAGESVVDARAQAVWRTRPVGVPEPSDFVPFPRAALGGSIAARFAEQAAAAPDKVAIRFAGAATSYRELERWSNQMAHRLLADLGSENSLVGLLVSQGPALVAAILGCLKANKAYVPLDDTDSVQNLRCVAEHAGLQAIVADDDHVETAVAVGAPLGVLALREIHGCPNTPVDAANNDSIACIYYTSGSTGQPKGVSDTHGNVLHNIMRYTNSLRISASDRLTLLQAPTFSGVVSSMFGALLNGATLCLWDFRRSGLSGLSRWIHEESISVYHSVPSIFRAVASERGQFDSIRVIRLEGDQATHRDVEAFRTAFGPHCILVNGLGATECGLCRQYALDKRTIVQPGPLPIGYAVEDVAVCVVDDDGRPVTEEQIGEIVVTSAYLSLGYWRRHDLTEAKFSPGSGRARTYRTGDLGRMDRDGCVTLLGRTDLQHKILGRHIDIPAVETALLRVTGVRQAAARTIQDEKAGAFLCGYVVADPGFDVAAVRAAVREELPDWMIPSQIIALSDLPLDANGKIKRASLPHPNPPARQTSVKRRSPTPIEAALAGLWESVLERPGIDLGDDFFALGGNSLTAMRLVSGVESALGVVVPVNAVFQDLKTIAAMAAYIQAARAGQKA